MYVLDTSVIIDFLRGRLPLALDFLKNTDSRLIKIPAIVKAELLVGAEKSRNVERSRRAVEEFLVNFEALPFDERCASHYAIIRAQLELAGNRIESNDLQIAATAFAHDTTLVTNGRADFKRISDLRLMFLEETDLPA